MAEPYKMTAAESEFLTAIKKWVAAKLESAEGFSVLLLSMHSDGKRMTRYDGSTVEEALEKCKQELRGELKGATDYVLCHDARYKKDGSVVPLLIFQMEHAGSPISMQVGQFYQLKNSWFGSKLTFREEGNLQLIGQAEAWLA